MPFSGGLPTVAIGGPSLPGLRPITPPTGTIVNYRLDKKVADPWNMVIGGQYQFNKRFALRAEAGFIGRISGMLSLNYRFGF